MVVITLFMNMQVRWYVVSEEMVRTDLTDPDADGDEARPLQPQQTAAVTHRIAFGPRVG